LDRGTVVVVDLDPATGHEQRGVRPCMIVGDPNVTCLGLSDGRRGEATQPVQ
jgi:mRNA-degrading endonuclease toxin of MazEF toxin-antitoxin module